MSRFERVPASPALVRAVSCVQRPGSSLTSIGNQPAPARRPGPPAGMTCHCVPAAASRGTDAVCCEPSRVATRATSFRGRGVRKDLGSVRGPGHRPQQDGGLDFTPGPSTRPPGQEAPESQVSGGRTPSCTLDPDPGPRPWNPPRTPDPSRAPWSRGSPYLRLVAFPLWHAGPMCACPSAGSDTAQATLTTRTPAGFLAGSDAQQATRDRPAGGAAGLPFQDCPGRVARGPEARDGLAGGCGPGRSTEARAAETRGRVRKRPERFEVATRSERHTQVAPGKDDQFLRIHLHAAFSSGAKGHRESPMFELAAVVHSACVSPPGDVTSFPACLLRRRAAGVVSPG